MSRRSAVAALGRTRAESIVVHRGTATYAFLMTLPNDRPADVSVRQFVADSGSVTRGLRQGRAYILTLNGEPLAKMVPIRRRQAVPKEEVLAIFATAPVIDADELRSDLDSAVGQDLATRTREPICDGARGRCAGHQHHRGSRAF